MALPSRESDYVTTVRESARKVWNGYLELKAAQSEWNAQDYGNTLDTFEGENAGLSSGNVGSAVFATADALTTLFNSGHATNLTNLL